MALTSLAPVAEWHKDEDHQVPQAGVRNWLARRLHSIFHGIQAIETHCAQRKQTPIKMLLILRSQF